MVLPFNRSKMMAEAQQRVQSFMTTLQQMERAKDASLLLKFFTKDAQISSIALRRPLIGSAGAEKFWKDYLAMFQTVASEFVHVHANGDLAVLEWKSEGVLNSGEAINYQGVSILEFAGESIGRFRTYYDSAAFLPEGAKLLGREVETA